MNKSPSIRRWGVAALTGVTLFGGLSIVGAGVASAATTPTVTAALTSGATATTIAGTVTGGGSGNSLTLTVAGTPVSGDKITLTLACPSTGTAVFDVVTDTASADFGAAVLGTNTAGCSTATFTSTGTVANPSLVLSPLTYTTNDVSSQALSISGSYATLGLAATTFSAPTDANVSWFNVSANNPVVTLPKTGTTAVSPISITEPANLPGGNLTVGDTITLTLPAADTWGAGTTLSTTGGTAALTGQTTRTLTITVDTVSGAGNSILFTINNATVITAGASVGAQIVTIDSSLGSVASVSVGSILGNLTTIYGADGTADGTVAAEFENAYPASSSSASSGNRKVVLATDAPSANGSDALAASYLEGTLGTGLLITPSTTLGTDAQQAMKLEGVTTVYVVGGPLAVSPAVIAQIKALPAYNAGGLTLTGSNVTVVGPIYGTDGTAAGTAAAIAQHFGTAYGAGAFPGAYSASGGTYNDSTGNASTTGPTSAVPTAIVIASTDWQDAMSVAPEAFNQRFPVILAGPSTDTSLGADASATLTALGVKQVIVIGGQFALQNSVETQIAALNGGISVLRIAGIDATDTAVQIANFALASGTSGLSWTAGNHSVLVSHVDYWTDALGAAALGGGANATFGTQPIILVESPLVIGQYTTKEMPVLGAGGVANLTVLGGPLAMPSSTVQTLLAGL
ncbi:MAG TPA: cell wall-binding repeat-containing protein [Acidimicrobiales bacterium]